MVAVVEEKKQRAPAVKTKAYYATLDQEASQRYPIDSFVNVHRGRGWSHCKVVSPARRGKIEVVNMITGKQYWAALECLQAAPVASPQPAQEPKESRSRPSIVQLFLQPITNVDKRSPEYVDRARMLPLSSDELIAYTALSAICKTLNNLHLNADSFRDRKLFDLLKQSHSCLSECLREMETYNELPLDA